MTHTKFFTVSRITGLLAMAIIAGGPLNAATAGDLYSITAIATQVHAPYDPYRLSAEYVTDQLTTEFVGQIIEDLDQRLPTELNQLIAAVN